ncbi:hypothetical protein Barb6_00925 [Bacteroidales bacterium Barb6]|nr:hypothetical protein Barb6_00925 [Bacteroidales bacterium Barb6]
MRATLLLPLAILCFSLPGTAQDNIYVTEYSEDLVVNTGASWETSVSLNFALLKAKSGDTLRLAQGWYRTPSNGAAFPVTKSLTLVGGYKRGQSTQEEPSGDASTTILYGRRAADEKRANRRVMIIIGKENEPVRVTVTNLTMTGGNGDNDWPGFIDDARLENADGGGGLLNCFAVTVLRDVIIKDNMTSGNDRDVDDYTSYGGGIFNLKADLTITGNSIIKDNRAGSKGTRYGFGGGICNLNGTLTIDENTRIENNTASYLSSVSKSGSGYGGGIYSGGDAGTRLVVKSGTIIGNTALDNPFSSSLSGYGGGIANDRYARADIYAGTVIKNNTASNSLASGYGGGISNSNSGYLQVSGVSIESNIAMSNPSGSSASFGGGIYFEGLDLFSWTETAVIKSNIACSNSRIGENIYPEIAHTVEIPAGKEYTVSPRGAGAYAVKKGSTFHFSLTMEDEYKRVVPIVTESGGSLQAADIENDLTYPFSILPSGYSTVGINADHYTVTFAEPPQGVSFPTLQSGEDHVFVGKEYNLLLKTDDNIYVAPVVTANEDTVPMTGKTDEKTYRYLLTGTSNKTIRAKLYSRAVTFADLPATGVTLETYQAGVCHVPSDSLFAFTLTVDDEYKSITPVVTANGRTLSPIDSENQTVYRYALRETEDSVQIKFDFYTVTLPEPPQDIFFRSHRPGTYHVPESGTFDFKLTTDDKYKNMAPGVTVNGHVLLPSDRIDEKTCLYSLTKAAMETDHAVIEIADYHAVTLSALPEEISYPTPYSAGLNYVPSDRDLVLAFVPDERSAGAGLTVVVDNDTLGSVRLNNGVFTVIIPNTTEDISVTLLWSYRVTLMVSDYAETDIQPGEYVVPADSGFVFALLLHDEYRDYAPVVLANSYTLSTISAESKRRYTVTLPSVRENTELQIKVYLTDASFLPENAVRIYSGAGSLVIESPAGEVPVTVCTLTGRIKAERAVTGTESIALPAGIYIVKAGTEIRKIAVNH